jgi:hypothetical protein
MLFDYIQKMSGRIPRILFDGELLPITDTMKTNLYKFGFYFDSPNETVMFIEDGYFAKEYSFINDIISFMKTHDKTGKETLFNSFMHQGIIEKDNHQISTLGRSIFLFESETLMLKTFLCFNKAIIR